MTFTRREEHITYKDRPTKVIVYSAQDTQEIMDGLKTLTEKHGKVSEYDLFTGRKYDEWSGAKSKEEAWELLRHGTNKKKLMEEVKSYIDEVNAGVVVEKYRDIEYRPFGCAVCVPRMLSGNPNCMILPKKAPVKTRVIKLLVDCGVSAYFSSEDYKRVGSVIARAINDVEMAGYRVRMHAVDVTYNDRKNDSKILCTHVMIKGENEPMNLQRLLYPIAESSFLRHLGFTTVNRADGWSNSYELYPILDRDNNPQDRLNLYTAINGPGSIMLRMQHLGNVLKEGNAEDVKKVVQMIFKADDELVQGGN